MAFFNSAIGVLQTLAAAPMVWIGRQESNMHISYKPLWHTLLERDMRKEDLRLAAGMTTNMIANMSKEGKHISMDTIPDLKLSEERRPIGKYGRMHREYLREVHPARLNTLILTGELWTYLADLNEQAQERLDTIMEQMKAAEGVTEDLKRTRQMEWVQRCNNIHNRAEEIVLHEMIYS